MLFSPQEQGQSFIEYAFLLVLIAVVVLLMVMLLGTQLSSLYSTIIEAFPD
jgi:pilus assembly protein Flp/PilA